MRADGAWQGQKKTIGFSSYRKNNEIYRTKGKHAKKHELDAQSIEIFQSNFSYIS
jgi:hypothetical protein